MLLTWAKVICSPRRFYLVCGLRQSPTGERLAAEGKDLSGKPGAAAMAKHAGHSGSVSCTSFSVSRMRGTIDMRAQHGNQGRLA